MDIRPISPDLIGDYFELFDNAFADNPWWAGCFCAFYDDPVANEEWDASDPEFAMRNRANRMATIDRGEAHGLLAYTAGRPVGWVNAGPRDRYQNLRIFAEAISPDDGAVGSIMCFVIHPDHRGQRVATALLGAVDGYFRDLNLEVAEGYPRKAPPDIPDFPFTAAYYKGTPSMFAQAGYVEYQQFDQFISVRKTL